VSVVSPLPLDLFELQQLLGSQAEGGGLPHAWPAAAPLGDVRVGIILSYTPSAPTSKRPARQGLNGYRVRNGMSSSADSGALLLAARRSFVGGAAAAARATCLEILDAVPQHAGALHLLGVIAHQAGDTGASEDYLRRAAEAPGTEALYILSYAELCRRAVDRAAALALTRRALGLEPGSAPAWYSLGSQLLDMGEYAESRASLERALSLDAKLWQARAGLAVLAALVGNPDEALARFAPLLADDDGRAEVIAQFARVLQVLGRHQEALEQIERAIQRDPDAVDHRWRAVDIELELGRLAAALARVEAIEARFGRDARLLAYKATLLRLTDRIPEALDLCREASARGVQSPDLWRAFAQVLHLAGEDDLALAAFDRATEARPALALSQKAVVLGELGRLQEARATFDRALAHEPMFVTAWYDKAQAKTHRRGDPDIASMEQLLARGGSHQERMMLHFALGKALFESGDTDAAFDHWTAGNRLKRALVTYDADAASQQLQQIAMAPVCDLDEPALGTARSSRAPVFVVGMPRCGSSLIEHMLAAHPDVHGGGEQLRLCELFAPYCLDPAAMGNDETVERIARAGLGALLRRSARAAYVIDKALNNFKHLGVIRRVFPNARIIHCRRDPLDTCFSAYTKLFVGDFPFTYDLGELGRYYSDYRRLMEHWRRTLCPGRFMEVDYETLVLEPRATAQALADFLALPWNEACLRFFEMPRTVSTASFAQVRQPVYGSSVGRAAPFHSRLRPLIEALGQGGGVGRNEP
jgi:tetratricopeptide (TPR) repeat protein